MNKYDMSERNQWKKILSRMALVLISVVIIVLFIPRNSGPQFRYDVGKPWMYGSLIAKFDFPIYKTDEAIKQERDSLLRNFEPYFNFKDNMESAQMTRFFEDFTGGLPGMPATYTNIVADKLHQLYKSGIMGATEFSSIAQDTTKMIRVIDGKTAYSVRISRVLSTMTAYEQIYLDERLAPYRAQLQRCNLNEYIEPNLIYDKERSEAEKNDLLGQIPLASGMVLAGQKIVDRGEIVDDYTFRVLSSLKRRPSAVAPAQPPCLLPLPDR